MGTNQVKSNNVTMCNLEEGSKLGGVGSSLLASVTRCLRETCKRNVNLLPKYFIRVLTQDNVTWIHEIHGCVKSGINMVFFIQTYIPLTLYPRMGSRGISVVLRDTHVLPK
jgi:hypothetical protein